MASNLLSSWRFSGLSIVGLLVLLDMMRSSYGYYPTPTPFQPSPWTYAHATFYGDDSAASTMGGACGYGSVYDSGYGTDTAALSSVMFNNGYGCGSCYEIKCVESQWCIGANSNGYGGGAQPTITVTATNLCPPNWYQASDNGGWCNPPRQHFDLTKPAFEKLAVYTAGIIPVQYRRVPCQQTGGIRFYFEGNPYWLLVYVMNVGGSGDISQMWVKGTNTDWIGMSHNWGASYQAFGCLGGQALSFKIQSYTTGQIIIAYNVAPQFWSTGRTYETDVNFY